MNTPLLQSERNRIADSSYESYDFFSSVTESSGWEYEYPGNTMTKQVYLESVVNSEEEGTSFKVYFTVVFLGIDSSVLSECYAISENGCLVGRPN